MNVVRRSSALEDESVCLTCCWFVEKENLRRQNQFHSDTGAFLLSPRHASLRFCADACLGAVLETELRDHLRDPIILLFRGDLFRKTEMGGEREILSHCQCATTDVLLHYIADRVPKRRMTRSAVDQHQTLETSRIFSIGENVEER